MPGTLNPSGAVWTLQKTTVNETAAGSSVSEIWTGPAAGQAAWTATKTFGTAHGTYTTARLRRKENNSDPSKALGIVTLVYDPPEPATDMPPSGSEFIEFSEETYTEEVLVNPLTPGEGTKTVEGTQLVYRVTHVGPGEIDIADIEACTQYGGPARPVGIAGGSDANWTSKCESARKEGGTREIVVRHVYRET